MNAIFYFLGISYCSWSFVVYVLIVRFLESGLADFAGEDNTSRSLSSRDNLISSHLGMPGDLFFSLTLWYVLKVYF